MYTLLKEETDERENQNDFETLIKKGNIAKQQGNNLEATTHYTKAFEIYTKTEKELLAYTLINKGIKYHSKKDYAKAIIYFREALKVEPKLEKKIHSTLFDAYFKYANQMFHKDHYIAALEYYKKSFILKPKKVEIAEIIFLLHNEMDNLTAAKSSMKKLKIFNMQFKKKYYKEVAKLKLSTKIAPFFLFISNKNLVLMIKTARAHLKLGENIKVLRLCKNVLHKETKLTKEQATTTYYCLSVAAKRLNRLELSRKYNKKLITKSTNSSTKNRIGFWHVIPTSNKRKYSENDEQARLKYTQEHCLDRTISLNNITLKTSSLFC